MSTLLTTPIVVPEKTITTQQIENIHIDYLDKSVTVNIGHYDLNGQLESSYAYGLTLNEIVNHENLVHFKYVFKAIRLACKDAGFLGQGVDTELDVALTTEILMSECGEAELCPITQGDTAPFIFEFIGLDDEPMDLTGMQLHFTMKLDPEQEVPDLHHVLNFLDFAVTAIDHSAPGLHGRPPFNQIAFTDPVTNTRKFKYDFATGKGTMKILPRETALLKAGQCYFFAFQLIGGPEDIYTVGSGKIKVEATLARVKMPIVPMRRPRP